MSKKKQNILTVILTIIGVAIIVLMLVFANKDKTVGQDDESYSIDFKVYYQNEELVIDDTLKFNEGESLLSLMERTYDIKTKQDGGMVAILSIDGYESDFVSSYFSLYIDGKYASIGPKNLILTGGLLIEWKWMEI